MGVIVQRNASVTLALGKKTPYPYYRKLNSWVGLREEKMISLAGFRKLNHPVGSESCTYTIFCIFCAENLQIHIVK